MGEACTSLWPRGGRGCQSHPAQGRQPRSSWLTHAVRTAARCGSLGRALGKQRGLITSRLRAPGSPLARCRLPKACAAALAGCCHLRTLSRHPLGCPTSPLCSKSWARALPAQPLSAAGEQHRGHARPRPNMHRDSGLCLRCQGDRARDGAAAGIAGSAPALQGSPKHSTFLLLSGAPPSMAPSSSSSPGLPEHSTFLPQPCPPPAAAAPCRHEAPQHPWPQSDTRRTAAWCDTLYGLGAFSWGPLPVSYMNRLLAPQETLSLRSVLDRASSTAVISGKSFERLSKASVTGTFKIGIYLSDTEVLTNFKHNSFFSSLYRARKSAGVTEATINTGACSSPLSPWTVGILGQRMGLGVTPKAQGKASFGPSRV